MNWTGGSLQQSRRAGATITAQQRNYFARARVELLNGRKAPSPPRLDLAHAQADYEASKRRGTHQSKARRGESLQWGSDDTPDVPSITNPRSSITTYETAQEPAQSGRIRKRKAHEQLDLYTEEGLHAKRLELLSGKDWFNTPTPKPLEITFPSRKEVQMIGRRRKLTDKEKERHKERMRERKMNTGVRIGNAKYDTSPKRRGHDHQDQIAVKIGDSLPDSQTMTQTPTLRSENPRRHRRVSSYSIGSVPCSDEMLLDAGMLCSDELLLDVEMSSEASLPFGTVSPLNISIPQRITEASTNPTRLDPLTTLDKTLLGKSTQSFSWDPLAKTAEEMPSELGWLEAGHSAEDDGFVDLPRHTLSRVARLAFESLPPPLPDASSSNLISLDDELLNSERSVAAQASDPSWAGFSDSDDGGQGEIGNRITDEAKADAKDEDDEAWYAFVFPHETPAEESEEPSSSSVEDGTPWRKSRSLRRRQWEETYMPSSNTGESDE